MACKDSESGGPMGNWFQDSRYVSGWRRKGTAFIKKLFSFGDRLRLDHLAFYGEKAPLGPIQREEALLLFSLVRVVRPRTVLELGFRQGDSALNFLEALPPDSTLISVDCSDAGAEAVRMLSKRFPNFKFVEVSQEALRPEDFGGQALDMVFFDASHVTELNQKTFEILLPYLSETALVAVHDTGVWKKSVMTRLHREYAGKVADGVWLDEETYSHQAGERAFVNWIAERYPEFGAVHLHSERTIRNGLTILQRKKRLPLEVSEGSSEEVYVADVEAYPIGYDKTVVHLKDTERCLSMEPQEAEMFLSCGRPKTVSLHALTHFLDVGGEGGSRGEGDYEKALTVFREAGLLQTVEGALEQGLQGRKARTSPKVDTFVWVTKDRGPLLEKSVRSFMENAREFGRDVRFLVADGSLEAETRGAYQEMLTGLGREFAQTVDYIGLEQREAFFDRMEVKGPWSREVLQFAFSGCEGWHSAGANHNCNLIEMAGHAYVSMDDDVRCALRLPPGGGLEGLHFETVIQQDYAAFRAREEALSQGEEVWVDFAALHERWLGRELGPEDAKDASVGKNSPELFLRFARGGARIVNTYCGYRGDLGNDQAHSLFCDPYFLTGVSEGDYELLGHSREQSRSVRKPTAGFGYYPGLVFGSDHTLPLPPRFPLFRTHDSMHNSLLWHVMRGGCFLQMPYTVAHVPPARGGEMKEMTDAMAVCQFASVFDEMTKRFDNGLQCADLSRTLSAFGSYLTQFACVSFEKFEFEWMSLVTAKAHERIHEFETLLEMRADLQPWVIRDAEKAIDRLHRLYEDPRCRVPEELESLEEGGDAIAWMKEILGKYGCLLSHWFELMEAAAECREGGRLMAIRLHEAG